MSPVVVNTEVFICCVDIGLDNGHFCQWATIRSKARMKCCVFLFPFVWPGSLGRPFWFAILGCRKESSWWLGWWDGNGTFDFLKTPKSMAELPSRRKSQFEESFLKEEFPQANQARFQIERASKRSRRSSRTLKRPDSRERSSISSHTPTCSQMGRRTNITNFVRTRETAYPEIIWNCMSAKN